MNPRFGGFTRFSLVGAGGVQGVFGEDFAGGGVDDGGVVVVDQGGEFGG